MAKKKTKKNKKTGKHQELRNHGTITDFMSKWLINF